MSRHASQLSAFFNAYRGSPIHIEPYYSPDPDPPLLTNGANIAIAKQFLIKAFVSANSTFTSFIKYSPDLLSWSVEDATMLLDASLIMLLVGSENLTAINTRRRILVRFFDELGSVVVTPGEEIQLLDGILTSQLVKHNKSPSLWYHRRWLVERYGVGILSDDGLAGEMRIVERSGEVHLGNYHAWNYARFITDTFYSLDMGVAPPLRETVERHARFCLLHFSDTSSWSFLFYLFSRLLKHKSSGARSLGRRYIFDIIKETMEFAHSTACGHEGVWGLLKTVLVSDELLGMAEWEELLGIMETWVGVGWGPDRSESKEAMKERELEKRSLEWIRKRRSGR